ncbi:MAG: hypothetical protein WCI88_14335 [Chloroflexota bacterium]
MKAEDLVSGGQDKTGILNEISRLPADFRCLVKELSFQLLRHWIECLCVCLCAIVLGIWLAQHVNGLSGWGDPLTYIHLAFNRNTYLGRSTHIYLLAPFVWFSNSIISGANAFSATVVSMIFMLTYTVSRYLSRSMLVGIVSILILWAQPYWVTHAGDPSADYTVAMFSVLVILIFLFAVQNDPMRNIVLLGMGCALYFTFHAKEINATMLLPLGLGLGFGGAGQPFSLNRLVRDILFISMGILLGIVGLMILDTLITHDPLRSIRIDTWMQYMQKASIPESQSLRETLPWLYKEVNRYAQLAMQWESLTSLLLYIISIQVFNRYSRSQRVVWLIPLTQILIWAAVMSVASQGSSLRHFFPAMVVISICAAQVFTPIAHKTVRDKLVLLISSALAVILAIIYYNHWFDLVAQSGWSKENALNTIFSPLLLSALLITIFLSGGKWKPILFGVPLFCLLTLTANASVANGLYLQQGRPGNNTDLFYPLETFKNELSFSPDMNIFVSKQTTNENFFYPYYEVTSWLFEIYLKKHTNQFTLTQENLKKYVQDYNRYRYAFVTSTEWNSLPAATRKVIEQGHRVLSDPAKRIILIKVD